MYLIKCTANKYKMPAKSAQFLYHGLETLKISAICLYLFAIVIHLLK